MNASATYCDQSNLGTLQKAALEAGKKHIFLVVFDGMDWQTIQAAAVYKSGKVSYKSGKGAGLHFQDYSAAGTAQFGPMSRAMKSAEVERISSVSCGAIDPS